MKKNRKKLLLAGVACALGLSLGGSTYAVYEKELIKAASNGDLADIQFYIAKGANVNCCNRQSCYFSNDPVYGQEHGEESRYITATAIYYAANKGHWDVVKWLVEHGANVNEMCYETLDGQEERRSGHYDYPRTYESYPVLSVARQHRWDMVRYLVEQGADINVCGENITYEWRRGSCLHELVDNYYSTAKKSKFNILSYARNEDEIRFLVELGANNNQYKSSNLLFASRSNNIKQVKSFIMSGDVKVNDRGLNGVTALMAAVECGHVNMVKLLLNLDADVNAKSFDGKTALILAAEKSNWNMCSLLIENGAEITPNCRFILAKIAGEGNLDTVKLLLKKSVDINEKDKNGNTALVNAAANGKWDMVDFLYEQGAVINEDSSAALIDAVKKGDYKLVKFLIDNGAKVNVSDVNGTTALMWASYIGNIDLIKFLIDCGADINAKNKNGDIAFVFAARDCVKSGKKVNKDVGAIINILNNYKPESIYKPIARPVNKKIEKSNPMNPQNNRGVGLDIQDPNGDTALIMAARINNLDMVRFLVNSGADPTITNNEGYTALMYATKNNNFEMVKLLTTKIDSTKISCKQCNVCWNKKEANEFAYIFKCGEKYGHHVCKECLQKIVHGKENPKCPVCQQEAIAEKIMEFLKEQSK